MVAVNKRIKATCCNYFKIIQAEQDWLGPVSRTALGGLLLFNQMNLAVKIIIIFKTLTPNNSIQMNCRGGQVVRAVALQSSKTATML